MFLSSVYRALLLCSCFVFKVHTSSFTVYQPVFRKPHYLPYSPTQVLAINLLCVHASYTYSRRVYTFTQIWLPTALFSKSCYWLLCRIWDILVILSYIHPEIPLQIAFINNSPRVVGRNIFVEINVSKPTSSLTCHLRDVRQNFFDNRNCKSQVTRLMLHLVYI